MILTEIFDQAARFHIAGNEGEFSLNGKNYIVDFLPTDEEDDEAEDPDSVEVSFGLRNTTGFGAHDYKLQGTGDEFQVFATVIKIIQHYVDTYNTNCSQIVFSAKMNEQSRVKLYDRMVARMATGWQVSKKVRHGELFYTLTKPMTPRQ